MSYNDKNNIKNKLDFLNIILPLYGINSLSDTDTEINSNNLTKFNEMTDLLKTIRKLFKVSVMNLSRNNNKIVKTNAIPILKHLCIQSHVPFDITKYSSHYTFVLADTNKLLEKQIQLLNIQIK